MKKTDVEVYAERARRFMAELDAHPAPPPVPPPAREDFGQLLCDAIQRRLLARGQIAYHPLSSIRSEAPEQSFGDKLTEAIKRKLKPATPLPRYRTQQRKPTKGE
jgi:hypothetical protein